MDPCHQMMTGVFYCLRLPLNIKVLSYTMFATCQRIIDRWLLCLIFSRTRLVNNVRKDLFLFMNSKKQKQLTNYLKLKL